jgi:hypothetical protein
LTSSGTEPHHKPGLSLRVGPTGCGEPPTLPMGISDGSPRGIIAQKGRVIGAVHDGEGLPAKPLAMPAFASAEPPVLVGHAYYSQQGHSCR